MVEKEFQEVFGFLILETDNASCEAFVDVEGLLASDWVYADDWVLGTSYC